MDLLDQIQHETDKADLSPENWNLKKKILSCKLLEAEIQLDSYKKK